MNDQELSKIIKSIVSDEFGGDPVARVKVRTAVDVDGAEFWHAWVILKQSLPRDVPVLRIVRRINDAVEVAGDQRFVLVDYLTVQEAEEPAE